MVKRYFEVVKDEFRKYDLHFNLEMDLGIFFKSIGDGVKTGLDNAKNKYIIYNSLDDYRRSRYI